MCLQDLEGSEAVRFVAYTSLSSSQVYLFKSTPSHKGRMNSKTQNSFGCCTKNGDMKRLVVVARPLRFDVSDKELNTLLW